MPISGIQDELLQVTVVGCAGLRDTSWTGKQRPYVCLEYGNKRVRTKSCKGGGTDPYFNEKFEFSLFEGLQFIKLEVWVSHSLSSNEMIGSAQIQLEQVLTNGYDDNSWPIWGESVRHGTRSVGQVMLILHYKKAKPPPPCIAPPYEQRTAAHPPSPATYNLPPLGYPPGPSFYPIVAHHPPLHHFPPPSPAPGRHHGMYPPPPYY